MKRWTRSGLGVVALLSSMALAAPAVAQEEEPAGIDSPSDDPGLYLSDDEIGQGSCDPAALPAGTLTDCRFPLSGEGWKFYSGEQGLHLSINDFSFAVSSPCVVEGQELVCRDLAVPSYRDAFRVDLSDYELGENRPTVTVDREFDSVLGIIQRVDRIKPVFAKGSLTLEVYRAGSLDTNAPVDVILRRPGSEEIESRAPALAPGETEGRFTLGIPDDGRWEFVSCALDAQGDCFKTGIPTALVALDPSVEPLTEGFNNPDDQRINIVFVGTGFDDGEQVRRSALALLSLDGDPITVDDFGRQTDVAGDVYDLKWGPFAIDPLRTNVGKFNLWYLPTINTGSPLNLNHSFGQPEVDIAALELGPHVAIVNLTLWSAIDGYRATGEMPSFSEVTFSLEPAASEPDLPTDRADIRFGSIYLPVTEPESPFDANVLSHEFGHALFGLRDEYEEYEIDTPTLGRPNCALDRSDAEALWGDLVGEVDPMYDRWAEANQEFGLADYFLIPRDEVMVEFVPGGCYAQSGGAIRPTINSLMNGNIPVFGSVNRRRAEQVLALWPAPTPVTTTTTTPPTTLQPAPTSTLGATATTEVAVGPTDNSGGGIAGGSLLAVAIVGLLAGGVGLLAIQRRAGAR